MRKLEERVSNLMNIEFVSYHMSAKLKRAKQNYRSRIGVRRATRASRRRRELESREKLYSSFSFLSGMKFHENLGRFSVKTSIPICFGSIKQFFRLNHCFFLSENLEFQKYSLFTTAGNLAIIGGSIYAAFTR